MKQLRNHSRMRGFTLVEAIIVIVLTGVLSGMMAVFIMRPLESYADAKARAELSDVADLALRRMSRELRQALPNSIAVGPGGTSIQFLLTKTGGRYADASDAAGGTILNFQDATQTSFDLRGAAPTGRQQIIAGDFIVVYNLGAGMAPADAYSGGNRATVTGVAGTRITMANNPFAVPAPPMPSPTKRFHVVAGTVTYICNAGTLTRFFSRAIPAAPNPATPPGTGAVLAGRVTGCGFTLDATAAQTGLVRASLSLDRNTGGNALTLVRQIHVSNSP